MTLRHFIPLILFLVPTIVIGYGFVIPGSCISGVNEHTVGFGITILSVIPTYVGALKLALPKT